MNELSQSNDNLQNNQNPLYYNYELVVSQYQILNSLSNNQNADFHMHHSASNKQIRSNENIQKSITCKSQKHFEQQKSKSESIIHLINSDSNVSEQSQFSKPTSIQNDFTKIKRKILNSSTKKQQKQQENQNKLVQVSKSLKNYEFIQKLQRKQDNQLESLRNNIKKKLDTSQKINQETIQKQFKNDNKKQIQSNIIRTIAQFIVQSEQQKESISGDKNSLTCKQDIQNKLTTPSVNHKTYNNNDLILQQNSLINNQLQEDYFQFIYHQLLMKNKQNQQLKQEMNILNDKIKEQQTKKMQANYKNRTNRKSINVANKLQKKKLEEQIYKLRQQLQYYKYTNDTLSKSVEQKHTILFQYYIKKQSKIDKSQSQNYYKILQLQSQLYDLNQNKLKGEQKYNQSQHLRLKKILQDERKKYLITKARHDSIQTGVMYLSHKKQVQLLKTLSYLQCAKKSVDIALNKDIKNVGKQFSGNA